MTPLSLTASDEAAVASAARILKSRYSKYVTYEDVQQECYAWLIENYDKVEQWHAEYDEERCHRVLVGALKRGVDRYCRVERAHAEGYEPEDEFFYSIPMVAELLILYFDPEWMQPRGVTYDDKTTGGKPASEGNNLVAMVADVGRAFERMAAHDRDLLRYIYADGDPADHIAIQAIDWGISFSAARDRVRRVVGRLRKDLGGPSPWN